MKTSKVLLVFLLLIQFTFGQQEQLTSKEQQTKVIDFTFENKSLKSIPLIIPSVMNPNLSPLSKSGVTLKIGQEVYFKNNGKKYILFIVNTNNYNGEVLDINELIKKRKKELNL